MISSALLLFQTGCAAPEPTDHFTQVEHACSACHGIDFKSNSSDFPRLAGQQKQYIINQLTSFQDRSRADPNGHFYMWAIAKYVDQPMIERLATEFSAMSPAPGVPGAPADVDAGRAIYVSGIAAQGVPACIRCHGTEAQGADAYPRLAGQHRAYLERQLTYFMTDARVNKTMHQNSKNLTEIQIRQVATYLAAQ